MKLTLKISLIALLTLFTVEKPLQAAIDPLTLGAVIAGGTVLGGIAGYLSTDPHDRPEEKRQEIAHGCISGFLMSLLASAVIIEASTPRVYTPRYVYPVRTVYRTTYYPSYYSSLRPW